MKKQNYTEELNKLDRKISDLNDDLDTMWNEIKLLVAPAKEQLNDLSYSPDFLLLAAKRISSKLETINNNVPAMEKIFNRFIEVADEKFGIDLMSFESDGPDGITIDMCMCTFAEAIFNAIHEAEYMNRFLQKVVRREKANEIISTLNFKTSQNKSDEEYEQ